MLGGDLKFLDEMRTTIPPIGGNVMAGRNIEYKTRANETFEGYQSAPETNAEVSGLLIITAIFGVDLTSLPLIEVRGSSRREMT